MMLCCNCGIKFETDFEPYELCTHCGQPMHKECRQYCVTCGKPLCDSCAPKHKWKCPECEQIAVHTMEFISSTMFESYLKCPYMFKELFILNKNIEVPNKWSVTGQKLHDLFDRWSQIANKTEDDRIKMHMEYLSMFLKIEPEMFDSDEDKKMFLAQGDLTIDNWFEEEKTRPLPLYTEKVHFTKLHDDLPPIRATIDRINGDPDDVINWDVEDYKTGKVYTAKKIRENMQLPIYAMTIKETYGALPKRLVLRFPQHQQERVFERITNDLYVCQVKRGGTYTVSLSETLEKMVEIYKNIQRDTFKPNTDDSHFCENFCPLPKMNKCGALTTRWRMLKQRGY